MTIHFATFGTLPNYSKSLKRIEQEAVESRYFDTISIYTQQNLPNLDVKYCENNQRGYGYWSWKSLVAVEMFKKIQDGDFLLYTDSGCTIYKDKQVIMERYIQHATDHDFTVFNMMHLEKTWTKGDIFEELSASDLKDTNQILATTYVMKKTKQTQEFVDEWYKISKIHQLISDSPSVIPNDPSFRDNRHDQSLFSVLLKKRGIFGIPDETYPITSNQMIGATRIRC